MQNIHFQKKKLKLWENKIAKVILLIIHDSFTERADKYKPNKYEYIFKVFSYFYPQ